MENFAWTCPYCNMGATITDANYEEYRELFVKSHKFQCSWFVTEIICCPNPDCRETVVLSKMYQSSFNQHKQAFLKKDTVPYLQVTLKPSHIMKHFPDYIPEPIRNDYEEACKIKELSPKASATLSRRCLQGMIRDFWEITKSNLSKAIKELEAKIDAESWDAIDSLRKMGNIGAHMEEDINLIIDVEPDEAQLLITLIEMLMDEWYIARHKRQEKLSAIKAAADTKTALKKGTP